MISSYSVLALIPARGGSKGVPRKNVRDLAGRPMIAWTIEAAHGSRYVDRIVLSSDDEEIIKTARQHGCDVPFVRPPELATDEADSLSVVRHALSMLPEHYDFLVLLQPTSPLRVTADIDGAVERCAETGAAVCVSVCETDKSPYWMLHLEPGGVVRPLFRPDEIPTRRQDAPRIYALNGAVYVARTDHLQRGGTFLPLGAIGYTMPKERSWDIDTELDLAVADFLLKQRKQ